MIYTICFYDNECFKWCLVRYLRLQIITQQELKKVDKYLAREFDFKYIKCLVRIRDTYKIEKMNCIISSFLVMKAKKNMLDSKIMKEK